MTRLARLLLVFCCCLPLDSQAADLGTMGTVWPIAETDLLTFIHQRLAELDQHGVIAREQAATLKRVRAHVLRPQPVSGLGTQAHDTVRYIDPTVTLSQAITTADGTVLYPAGTPINPLNRIAFTETLLFFNGDDARQVDRIDQWLTQHPTERVKLILTGGAVNMAVKHFHQRIFFDQAGALIHHFGIHTVPCTLAQAGKRLQLTTLGVDSAQIGEGS